MIVSVRIELNGLDPDRFFVDAFREYQPRREDWAPMGDGLVEWHSFDTETLPGNPAELEEEDV